MMMLISRFRGIALWCVVSTFALDAVSTLALAQEGSEQTGGNAPMRIEEIVVTATRREERMLDVPFSISVIGGEQLDQNQSQTLEEALTGTPGILALDFGGTEGTNIIMRGLSTAGDGEASGTTTALYFGESLVGGSLPNGRGSPNFRPVDINRIEMLRGPQGTLYGAGSLAGAVRIIPNAPDSSAFDAAIGTSFSDTTQGAGNGWTVQGHVNLPISEDVAIRLVGYKEDRPGFVRNITLNEVLNDVDVAGGRASLRWEPNDKFDLTATYVHQSREANGSPDYDPLLPLYQTDIEREFDERKSSLADLVINVATNAGTLTSVSTYYKDDFDTLSIRSGRAISDERFIERYAQELRFASQRDSKLGWLIGAYVERIDEEIPEEFRDPVTGQLFTKNFGFAGRHTFTDREQNSLFGELVYSFSEKLKATVGIRFADYKVDTTDIQLLVDPPVTGAVFIDELPGLNSPSNVIVDVHLDESAVTPRFNLSYKPTDNQTHYLQIAKGFRMGNTDSFISSFCDDAGAGGPFGSDSAWNYEVGSKIALASGRLSVSGALYYVEWEEIPLFLADFSCFEFYVQNAAKARSTGAELEVSALLSDHFSTKLTIAYNNAEITDISGANGAGVNGEKLVGAPDWLVNVVGDYSYPISSAVEFFAAGDVSYVGDYQNGLSCDFNGFAGFSPLPPPLVKEPGLFDCYDSTAFSPPEFVADPGSGSYVTVNAQVGIQTDRYKIYAYARNLFDDDTRTYINYQAALGSAYNRPYPRTVGVSIEAHFN